ncbi:MAG: hypothetical protein IJ381_08350 [Clostridia bacterium]|nr:hypothetical protein [Clostridia bacterium]
MTIKALEYIHRLLQEDFLKKEGAYQIARRNATEAEDDGAENAQVLEELRMALFNERQAARRALDEFEEQDFG